MRENGGNLRVGTTYYIVRRDDQGGRGTPGSRRIEQAARTRQNGVRSCHTEQLMEVVNRVTMR